MITADRRRPAYTRVQCGKSTLDCTSFFHSIANTPIFSSIFDKEIKYSAMPTKCKQEMTDHKTLPLPLSIVRSRHVHKLALGHEIDF